MSLLSDEKEKNQVLRKLLDFKYESLEMVMPEFHEKKNHLNYLRLMLTELDNSVNKGIEVDVSKKIKESIKVLLECMNDLNGVYTKLNHNPAKLHGYKTTLKKFCHDCSKKYTIEVEFDTMVGDIDSMTVNNSGIYSLCTAAIEALCIQGHDTIYVLLGEAKGKLTINISGQGKKQTLTVSQDYNTTTIQLLQGLIAWKMPVIKPETDWLNVISLEFDIV
jgi:hypothetical protein